jgi:hypothetical protein
MTWQLGHLPQTVYKSKYNRSRILYGQRMEAVRKFTYLWIKLKSSGEWGTQQESKR